jgi:two-component system NtrC family sensor kinase
MESCGDEMPQVYLTQSSGLHDIYKGRLMMKQIYHDEPTRYRVASRKILMIFIIVSFFPLMIITGSVLYQSHFFYHEKVRAQMENLVKIHTQNIDNFLKERLNNIRHMAGNRNFLDLCNEVYLNKMLESLQQYGPVFSDLGVVDESGRQLSYAGPFRLEKADYSEAQWFKKAIVNETYVSDVFTGLRGLPHFIVTSKKEWKGKPWILRATIDFRSFNNLVGNLRIGNTGFAFILNRQGEFQTETSSELAVSKPVYMDGEFLAEVSSKAAVGTSAYKGLIQEDWLHAKDKVRFVERNDMTGVKTIYTAASLKDGDWMMILQQTSADAFADLKKTQFAIFFNFILGSSCIIAAGVLLSRLVTRRLIRVDQEKEIMNQQIIESGKLASLGELAAGIAHEINNPVAIMVEEAGWIGDLLSDETFQQSENLEEFKRALVQINKQGIRCRDITQKLLSFARKSETNLSVVQINEIIDEVVGICGQHAKYANVTIETDYATGLPMIEVSQTEVQQVMLNLINNALDAMEKTGGKIDIKTAAEKGFIVILVSDNGPGIPEKNLSRIFDPFYTTKPIGKGTGLGLSICYGIISRMGGKIMVKSAVGSGTSFYIYLPSEELREAYAAEIK